MHKTIIAVIEMSQSKWLVAAVVPGIKRQPLKKLDADQESLLKLLHRWCKEAEQAGHPIRRVVVAYEAGREPTTRAIRWTIACELFLWSASSLCRRAFSIARICSRTMWRRAR